MGNLMSSSFINQNRLYKEVSEILKRKGLLFPDLEKRNDGNKIYYRKQKIKGDKKNGNI
jgi:hypothetical protein